MAGVNIPNDVILNLILTRVPADSANRFKCVSKGWNSFLTSDVFKEMHNRKKVNHQEHHKLLFISEKTSPRSFFTIDCEAPHKKVPCSRPLPPFEAGAYQICEIASCHGLVCLWVHPDIILWNPLTTEYKKLPRMDNRDWSNLSNGGLYYISSEDDYKLILVATYTGNVYIYSLKSDSWRMANNSPIKRHGCWKSYVTLNDSLYFLSDNRKKTYLIVRFDTTAESFQKIETPSVNDNNKPHSATITVYRGYVHYCVKYDITGKPGFLKSTCIELWKLNADLWKKVVSYDLMPDDIRFLSPVHLMRNGNWLMMDYENRRGLVEVDLKKKKYIKDKDNHCHRSKGKNKSKSKGHDECKLYYSSESAVGWPRRIRYTETYVSPNQYMK